MAETTDKKEAILRASVELFADRGFSDTPTSVIARRAKVAEGTIFHYFHSKKEILDHIVGRVLSLYLDDAAKISDQSGSGFEAVMSLINLHFALADRHSKDFLVCMRDMPARKSPEGSPNQKVNTSAEGMVDCYRKALTRGILDGSITPLPVDETASVILGMVIGILRQQFFGPRKLCDLKTLRAEALAFCARSIKPDQSKEQRC